MALKVLMLRRDLDRAEKALAELRKKNEEFTTREVELEQAIGEVSTDEERDAVQAEIDTFEEERAAHTAQVTELEGKVAELRGQIEELEAAQESPAKEPEPEKRSEETMKTFEKMNHEERAAFVQREDVKAYLTEVRSAIREKRALTNVGLTIPEVMLGMLKENIEGYSKLYSRVNLRRIGGTGRMVVMGALPEAVWTDCCANLNELALAFNDVEVDCFKVGGFFTICNANLEDSDVALAGEIMTALEQAIGMALDKAILYGGNAAGTSKMPLGIVSRLAQTSQPDSYPATARAWEDLHTSHMITVSSGDSTGVTLIKKLIGAAGKCKTNYSKGELTWCMNETTYAAIMTELVSVNAAGSVVTGMTSTMPVVGGQIVILPFMADNQIVAGYFDLYLLAERAGQAFATSEHVRFLEDQTVFKGTARYDGLPVIAEAFVAVGINNTAPSANMTFPTDKASAPTSVWLPATAAVSGTASITLVPVVTPNNAVTTFTWATSASAKATVDGGVVTGVTSGTSVITVTTANGLTAQCTVTVS